VDDNPPLRSKKVEVLTKFLRPQAPPDLAEVEIPKMKIHTAMLLRKISPQHNVSTWSIHNVHCYNRILTISYPHENFAFAETLRHKSLHYKSCLLGRWTQWRTDLTLKGLTYVAKHWPCVNQRLRRDAIHTDINQDLSVSDEIGLRSHTL